MYFVIACASVWFYRDHLQHSLGKFLGLGVLPLLGGLFMGVDFGYGLTTQAHVVSWVAAIIIIVVFALGFVIYAVRPSSPYFQEMKERRLQGVKGTDEVTAAKD
jgi:hypothetical protein